MLPTNAKNKKTNGYMLFVNELKSKGIIDKALLAPLAVSEADVLWKALSFEEQEIYKHKAKQQRYGGQMFDLPPMTSTGSNLVPKSTSNYQQQGGPVRVNLYNPFPTQPIEDNKKPPIEIPDYSITKVDEDLKMEIMNVIFGSNIMEKDKEALRTKKFLFGHFLYYFKTETTPSNYYPAEICFIEFSIEEGIGKTLHGPIYPGDIPSDYMTEVEKNEERKGLVPYDVAKVKSSKGSTTFVEIYNNLQEMMNDCSDSRIIFTGQDTMEQMEGCIRFFFEKAQEEGREDLKITNFEVKVLPVEILAQILKHEFVYLSKEKSEVPSDQEKKMNLLPTYKVEALLDDCELSQSRSLACLNHGLKRYKVGIRSCPLGTVKRWILSILELINYREIQHVYEMGHEKDSQHFFHKHVKQVRMLRKLQREEAQKKWEKEKPVREKNEILKIIREIKVINNRVSRDFGYSYMLPELPKDDSDEEEVTHPVMGRGRGRGRGNGHGNIFFK